MPATAIPDTGHGSSITFATTGGTYKCRQISGTEHAIPVVDTSYLGTSGFRTAMPGDLSTIKPVVMQILFQGTQGLPARGTVETITHTFPIPGGGAATPATVAGTGFITRVKYPDFQTDTLQIGEIEFTWDGNTGPAYTATA